MLRICFIAATGFQAASHSDEPLPDFWYEAYESGRQEELWHHRRLNSAPLPAKPPAGGDPEEVHIFVIGDWGTFPGTGDNMGSLWPSRQWNNWCFTGSRSKTEWEQAKANLDITAAEVAKSWGNGRPVCGSMHIECSWNKGGAANNDRCNPDKPAYWRDHYAQQAVAAAMTNLARERKASFVVNTADNFYMAGVDSTTNEQWSMMFEDLYPDESLQIPWLSSLGNHDYGGHECDYCLWNGGSDYDPRRGKPCSQAMIDYDTEHGWQWPSPKKVRWVLPMKGNDRWYMKSFKFPKANVTVDVFVIDTNKAHVSSQCFGYCPKQFQSKCVDFFMQMWKRQRDWLLPALDNSKADWKMVVGHAPPENFEASLMEEMRDRGVSVYMAGHVHQLRHDRHPSGIEAIISGSGGGYQSAGGGTAYTLHETQDYGFATMHVEYRQITVEYINDEGRRLWDPIVIPRVDVVQERILKSLREAAVAVNTASMRDQIKKAKEHGVDDSYINAAALAGVKAFEAQGGMAWVHMKPARMTSGETTFSGVLSSWSLEDSLPQEWTSLVYPRDAGACCGNLQLPAASSDTKLTVLCYPSPSCTPVQMAAKVSQAGAAAMLLASPQKDLEPLQADEGSNLTAKDLSMPVLSIPSLPMKDLASWLSNPAEKIGIQLSGGQNAYQAALDGARDAGVPKEVIEAAVREAQQRRAEEKLQAVMRSNDVDKIQEALDLASEFGAESDLIEQAKRKLTVLRLQAELQDIPTNCHEFMHVHELIQNAKALTLGNTSEAEICRMDLAMRALRDALDLGSGCQAPLTVAVAWCELAEVLPGAITAAQEDCAKQVAAASKRAFIVAAAVGVVVLGAGLCFFMRRKGPEAPASQGPGGIELLEANDAS